MRRMSVIAVLALCLMAPVSSSAAGPRRTVTTSPSTSIIHAASVTLSDDQIKALPTTPVDVVLAAGADTLLIPVTAVLRSVPVQPYANIDSEWAYASVDYGGDASEGLSLIVNDPNAAGPYLGLLLNSVTVFQLVPVGPVLPTAWTSPPIRLDVNKANTPLSVYAYNGSGNFTGGDPGNTLTVSVAYLILNLSTGQFE